MDEDTHINLILDTETTTFQKGNPFARRNKLCYIGSSIEGRDILITDESGISDLGRRFRDSSQIVGFNPKFDFHWIRRCGETSYKDKRIWDCQCAHFLLTGQRVLYPSLEGVCEYYNIPGKLNIVKEQYWDNNIDTIDIPTDTMVEYLTQDLDSTYNVFLHQTEDFKKYPKLYNLFRLNCQDLLVLAEMEWNGLMINKDLMIERAKELEQKLEEINNKLKKYDPHNVVNWNSVNHLSTILYGGTIEVIEKEPIGIYKSGAKINKIHYKNITRTYPFAGLVKPLQGSELKKEGYWSTDEPTLRQLKKHPVLELLLERSKFVKQLESFKGLPELIEEMDWEDNILHGQFNQCVAVTGRLSASKPNQHNFFPELKECIISRMK